MLSKWALTSIFLTAVISSPVLAQEWDEQPVNAPPAQTMQQFAEAPERNFQVVNGTGFDTSALRTCNLAEIAAMHDEEVSDQCGYYFHCCRPPETSGNTTLPTGALDNVSHFTSRTGKNSLNLPVCATHSLAAGSAGAMGLPMVGTGSP